MDSTIRQLERQARTGDPGAKASWITHKMRAGELSAFRTALASRLGDTAAQMVHPVVTSSADYLQRTRRLRVARRNSGSVYYYRRDNFDPDICWEAQVRIDSAISRFRDWRPAFLKAHPEIVLPSKEEVQVCLRQLCLATQRMVWNYLAWLPVIPGIDNALAKKDLNWVLTACNGLSPSQKKTGSGWATVLAHPQWRRESRSIMELFAYQWKHHCEHSWGSVTNLLQCLLYHSLCSLHFVNAWGLRTLRGDIERILQCYMMLAFHLGWLLGTPDKSNELCSHLADCFLDFAS